jgi:acetyltransferase-like isoleucine patch superfamily enzyme
MFFPWRLRRALLRFLLGWEIDSRARIGFAFIAPRHLIMGQGAHIGLLTVCKGLDVLELGNHALIGRGNWITGSPSGDALHYVGDQARLPRLILGEHAAITHRHLVDCTATIEVGSFSTIAGYRSQLLTHSIDLKLGRQAAKRIVIGDYCFVGTNCVVLGGARLPSCSVLAAKSLLTRDFTKTHQIYGGVPAGAVGEASDDWAYFHREKGFVA